MIRGVRGAAFAAACGGGVAIAWLLVRDPADGQARVVAPPRAETEAPTDRVAVEAAVAAAVAAVVLEEPRVDAASACEEAATEALPAEQAEVAIAALAASLRDPQWRRAAWDVEVAATRKSAGAAALDEIERRLAARDELDDDAFVAAAELLRGGGRPLASAAERLRRIAFSVVEEDTVSLVAARALAAGGDEVDRDRLLDRACEPDPATRSSAQWALTAAPADQLLALAVKRLAPGQAADATEALLLAIDGALRRAIGTELKREIAGATEAAIGERLADANADARLEARVRSAGKALARACQESNDPIVRDIALRLLEPPR